MPKAEKGSSKWLANKMKSKGLQKLRWYCQMCQKQCRDQNGFKCHTQSESHQRQLLLFAENPNKYLGSFSHEFERDFMHLLKRTHGTKRVKANRVYQEYIADKEHVHMNATRWETLTGFCHYLARTGKVKIDQTEEGWFIAWIDRDPETIERQEALSKKEKMSKDDEERLAQFIQQQVQRAKELKEMLGEDEDDKEMAEFKRENEDEKLQFFLHTKITVKEEKPKPELLAGKSALKEAEAAAKEKKKLKKEDAPSEAEKRKAPLSALEEIMIEEKRRKQSADRKKREERERASEKRSDEKDYWLKKGIVVKVVTKSLGEKYYKQKGVVKEVVEKYGAVVSLLDGGKKVKLDQEHLETVIPAVGKKVLVVNGKHRGEEGTLKSIDVDSFCAVVSLEEDGEGVRLPYEHFSKLYQV